MVQLKPVDGTDVYLWKYLPSIPAAGLFLGLFAIVTAYHCYRTYRARTWFCIPFAVGGVLQVVGYGVRIYCHWYTEQIASYVIQSAFIILAPVLYAASIYMILKRLIQSVHGDRFCAVPIRWLTWIFVAGDVLALNIQGNAVGLTSKAKTQKAGEIVITVGLIIQIIIFGFFCYVSGVFHYRMNKDLAARPRSGPHQTVPWREGLRMLYICSFLIMIRSVFRVVEYVMGVDSYLLTNEWPWYVFDATLMWITQVVFVIWFPDTFSSEEAGERLNSKGSEDGHALVEGVGSGSRA